MDIDALYSKTTVLGQWLRSKGAGLKLNNALFKHGGFHPLFAKARLTWKQSTLFLRHTLMMIKDQYSLKDYLVVMALFGAEVTLIKYLSIT